MAALMGVGFYATLKATEPRRAGEAMDAKEIALPLFTLRGFFDAVVGPFVMFFRTHRWLGLLMLAVISLYQIPNFVSGPMSNTFYHDIGLSKDAVGGIRASVGLVFSLLGIAAGGICAARFGYLRTLVAGIVLEAVAVAAFVPLAYSGGDLKIFAAMMAVDSFGLSFAGRRARHLYVEPDEPGVHRDAICAALVHLCLSRKNPQRLFRPGRGYAVPWTHADGRLCHILCRCGGHLPAGADSLPVFGAGAKTGL